MFNQRKRGESKVRLAPSGARNEHSVCQARFVEISRLNDQVHLLELERRMIRCLKNALTERMVVAEDPSPLGVETVELVSRPEHRLGLHVLRLLLCTETEQACLLNLVPCMRDRNSEDVALSFRGHSESLLEFRDDLRLQRGVERIVAFSLKSTKRLVSQTDQERTFVGASKPVLRFGPTAYDTEQKLLAVHEREELRLGVVWQNDVCTFSERRSVCTPLVAELELSHSGFLRNSSHLEEFHLMPPFLGVELGSDREEQFRPARRTEDIITRTARVGLVTMTAKSNTARRTVVVAILLSYFRPTIRAIARRNNNQLFLHRFLLSQRTVLPQFSNRRAYRTPCPILPLIVACIGYAVKVHRVHFWRVFVYKK